MIKFITVTIYSKVYNLINIFDIINIVGKNHIKTFYLLSECTIIRIIIRLNKKEIGEIMGKKRLSSSNGAGQKIIDNWILFTFDLKEKDETLYIFDVNFDGTKGICTIRLNDMNKIERVGLNMKNFQKSLLEYNDPSLIKLAERIMNELNIKIK